VVYAFETAIGVYDIGENGAISYSRSIAAPSTTDNPWMAPDGSIYFAGVSNVWKTLFADITGDKEKYMPGTEVSKLAPGEYELTQEYMDNGKQFQAASIAVFWEKNILVGSPFGNLMECHKV